MSTKLFPTKSIQVDQSGAQLGRFLGLDLSTDFSVMDGGKLLSVSINEAGLYVARAELADGLVSSIIPLTDGVFGAASDTPVATGKRKIDLSDYPATLAGLSRVIRFAVVLENALDSATYFSKTQLVDLTHAEVLITGTDLDNSSESDLGVANEFVSGPLTVGSSNGDLRSDVVSLYAVQVLGDGIVDATTERAILSNARLIVTYE